MHFEHIAVVGAGVMGSDIAFDLAGAGYPVVLKDISESALRKSRESIERNYKLYRMLRGDLDASLERIMDNIHFTLDYQRLQDVDLVIENIPEDFAMKTQLYSELSEICPSTVVYAVNTSCIPITRIGVLTKVPENVIGVHFMNPVPLNPLVELISGHHTSGATVSKVKGFLKAIKKTPVQVNDSPGFVANRISHIFMNEAACLVQEKIAVPDQVDIIFKRGYGHKMGPLETADLIGLDSVVNSLDILYASFGNPKFACCPLLRKMVAAGLLGRKSGQGFYSYE